MVDITLYRVTFPGDLITTIPTSEKLEISVDVNPLTQTAKGHGWNVEGSRDIPKNPIADEELSEHQDMKLGDEIYEFFCTFSQRSAGVQGGTNLEAFKFEKFYTEDQENDDFPAGRIGIQINTFILKKIVPSATRGGYITYRKWEVDPEIDNMVKLTFRVSENRES